MTREDEIWLTIQLRKISTKWSGRTICLNRFRRKVFERIGKAKGKKIFKYYYQCQGCKEWFRDSAELEVDHIEEIGPYKGDLHDFCERVFCNQNNLQPLCAPCHLKKTKSYASARSKYRRKV